MLGGNTICSFYQTISPAMDKMEKVVILLILLQSEYFVYQIMFTTNLHSLYFFIHLGRLTCLHLDFQILC